MGKDKIFLREFMEIEEFCRKLQYNNMASYQYEGLYVAYRATVYRLYC